jgi:hypothetical protein
LRLCVQGGTDVRVEAGGDDCGGGGTGCAGVMRLGAWHTNPTTCDTTLTGWGASGATLHTGWMELCADAAHPMVVDATTLTGKLVAGYQGWFATPDDGSAWDRWVHWFRNQTPVPASATFDLWPDLSEYPAATLAPTSMQYDDGSTASLYSAYHPAVVDRHFQWMARYGIDGAFLQRFTCELSDAAALAFRDRVTENVVAAAEAHGRVFVIMYDISGTAADVVVDRLQGDWQHLVDDLGVTGSDRYLRHRGRPLVAIWGFGFDDRPGTPAEAGAVIDFFHDAQQERYRATVMGGVPTHWRTGTGDSQPGFYEVYTRFDVVSPWSVGRYGDDNGVDAFNTNQIQPDLAVLTPLGIDYLPVVWPGFSWANLRQDPGLFNQIPRRGGRFFWRQIAAAVSSGANMLYVAMFDEVDEGTAIYKAAVSAAELPTTGQFLHLSQDGEAIPRDLYLRWAGAGAKLLQGQVSAAAPLR